MGEAGPGKAKQRISLLSLDTPSRRPLLGTSSPLRWSLGPNLPPSPDVTLVPAARSPPPVAVKGPSHTPPSPGSRRTSLSKEESAAHRDHRFARFAMPDKKFIENLSGEGKAIGVLTSGGDAQGRRNARGRAAGANPALSEAEKTQESNWAKLWVQACCLFPGPSNSGWPAGERATGRHMPGQEEACAAWEQECFGGRDAVGALRSSRHL